MNNARERIIFVNIKGSEAHLSCAVCPWSHVGLLSSTEAFLDIAKEHQAFHFSDPESAIEPTNLLMGKIDSDQVTTQRQIDNLRTRLNKLGDLLSDIQNALDDAFEKLAESASFIETWEREARRSHQRVRARLAELNKPEEPKL